MSRGKRKLKRRLGGGNEAEEVQTPDVEFDKKSVVFGSNTTDFSLSTLPACEVGQKYYALKKSSPFVNSR